MRIIDNITPHNSSWSAAQTKRESERERERERERQKETERDRVTEKKNVNEKKKEGTERELQMFFMMGFDSAISGFLPLLVKKSYRIITEKGKT